METSADAFVAVEDELRAVIAAVAAETTAMWASGRLDDRSVRARVTEDFEGVQYAPWFEDGVFRGTREQWLAGTREAALLYHGKGIRWETSDVVVAARSLDEAVACYVVTHHWPDRRPPSRALFLETWVKRDGEWWLRRHTSEKA